MGEPLDSITACNVLKCIKNGRGIPYELQSPLVWFVIKLLFPGSFLSPCDASAYFTWTWGHQKITFQIFKPREDLKSNCSINIIYITITTSHFHTSDNQMNRKNSETTQGLSLFPLCITVSRAQRLHWQQEVLQGYPSVLFYSLCCRNAASVILA